MAKAQPQAPSLSGEQLAELLRLIKGADTVELKLTVPESDHRSAAASLRLDVLDAQIRQVVFFDTPDLTLNQSGLVVRARRVQGKGDDSVVKLRPVVPDELPPRLRKSKQFGVEVDAMPGGFV
ncbi:MAG: adenylate cyclase, partial [Chloroflexota bacterium]|nr:adenylate cyclase [Chloroflexota bacterium]